MKKIKGDLIKLALDKKFDVIIHGCNCFCDFGAGIAKQIKETFPQAFEVDKKTKIGDNSKLGEITFAKIKLKNSELFVVNGYTQFSPVGSGVLADYEAIKSVFKEVNKNFNGQKIGYPKIGAGLAKGDWKIISKIIDEELHGEDHTLVEFATP